MKASSKKSGSKPYKKISPVTKHHLGTLTKEVERLVEAGVLERQSKLKWVAPTFIIPPKNTRCYVVFHRLLVAAVAETSCHSK